MYRAPEPINAQHDLSTFACGDADLESWLKQQALKNEKSHSSRTYVVCYGETQVVAYFCLAAGSVDRASSPGKVARNAPNPIPVIVLGRLAVDVNHQGQGIGQSLIQQACLRTLSVAEAIGVRALLVHAKNETVASYYQTKANLIPSADNPLLLFLPITQIIQAVTNQS